ncbi:Possible ABC transport system periplasmic substrate-binding protein [hydrothermal vent metagenome]|uniref:Possible ABC transport system periplasmic substrate-binding protein n=1 Tax=hydrothermal vent metagenome TaxID=652676 RepID=A0A1W1EE23_9ZZZZ
MYSKVNYTIVGMFVLIFGTGLIWFFFWLAKYGMVQEYDTYKLYMRESVAGLSRDSVVKMRGVNIGRVSQIRIDPNNIERVEVILHINKGTPIKEDMVAYTNMLGITGLLSIEIDGGSNAAKTLVPSDNNIPVIKTATSWLSKTKNELGDLSGNMNNILKDAQKIFTQKNIDNFSKILENMQRVSAKAEKVEDQFLVSLKEFDKRLVEYNSSINTINKNFADISSVTIPAINKIYKTSDDFDRVTLKMEESLDRGDYNMKLILDPMLVEISILSEQMNDMAKELKQSPSDIFFKSRRKRPGPGE